MSVAVFLETQSTASPDSTTPAPRCEAVAPNPRRINPWMMFVGAMVPNWLLCRPEISQGAKLCYARLAQFAGRGGKCFPKQDTVAEEIGVSERMVRDYLRELGEFRLIESEQHGLGTSNTYHFLDHPWIQECLPDTGAASAPDRKNSSGQDRQSSSVPIEKRISEENQGKEIHTHQAQGLPRSEQEAVEQAQLVGVPPEFARVEFCRLDSTGGVNGAGIAVRKWPSHVRKRWADHQSQQAERRATGRPSRPTGPPRQFAKADYTQPVENF